MMGVADRPAAHAVAQIHENHGLAVGQRLPVVAALLGANEILRRVLAFRQNVFGFRSLGLEKLGVDLFGFGGLGRSLAFCHL